MGPFIHAVAEFEPQILIQAILYTSVAFVSFSCISLLSKRRSYLFLGGIIMTIVQCMCLYSLFSWGFGFRAFALPYLICGLLVACLYIIYDTQVIIERAEHGDKDVPTHAMMLFIDLFDLFIKILRILMELKENERKKRRDD